MSARTTGLENMPHFSPSFREMLLAEQTPWSGWWQVMHGPCDSAQVIPGLTGFCDVLSLLGSWQCEQLSLRWQSVQRRPKVTVCSLWRNSTLPPSAGVRRVR